MEDSTTVDTNGAVIRVGDAVKVLSIEMETFSYLDPDEIEDIRSMIGQTLSVEEIAATGSVTVTKWFDRGQGDHESHTLSLLPRQIEAVG